MKAEQQWIKKFNVKLSTKYPDRYDVNDGVNLHNQNLTKIPIPFGVVNGYFICSNNKLTTLYNAPIEVHGYFACYDNQLTTLDHLPKHIGSHLVCINNPFQNLNGLKNVIKRYIYFPYTKENELDYWVQALYNTNLDALEYHYNNHRYEFGYNHQLENYIKDVLEEIIKLKRLKRDLNV